ncbi:MAG: ABC transporter ATP-binding protein [Chloroflexi bacterium]|nr:ABC transporter ATP-binding protein [Chloroflexota bacterium]
MRPSLATSGIEPTSIGHVANHPAHLAVEIEGLSKTFYNKNGPIKAVDNLNLSIPAGQVFGFLGPNGAGKTTTIKMMLGLVIPDAGRVYLNGYDVERSRSAAVRQVGAVLEGSRNVYWTLSAWQNLLYFGRLKGLSTNAIRPRAEYLLQSLGLWPRRHESVGGFSRGMQQKVAVAALIADPPIVLFDEPTLGLDVEAARTVRDWIVELAGEHGKTVVLTTHQLNVAEELCDRLAVIREGRVMTDLPTGELLRRFRQQDLYRITVRGRADGLPLPAGFTMRAENGSTVINGPVEDDTVLYTLVDTLRDSGLSLLSISQVQPALEDVFLELIKGEHKHG